MNVDIRSLIPDEAEAYSSLRQEMLQESPKSFGASPATDVASQPEPMRKRLESQGINRTFGAFDSATGALVGVVGGGLQGPHEKRGHAFYVWGMYVTPAARSHGVARKLMGALLDYSATLPGICVVALSVSATAPRAEAMYKSMGFKEWGREPRALKVAGEFLTEIHMCLVLESS
jgi:GNAT superfamily N-acetyltransferase